MPSQSVTLELLELDDVLLESDELALLDDKLLLELLELDELLLDELEELLLGHAPHS